MHHSWKAAQVASLLPMISIRSDRARRRGFHHAWFGLEKTASACDHARMTRIPALEGGCNFRDFGGYATSDGRRVRWGRLFRSGAMHRLTAADRQRVAGLGIRTVVDLRRPDERRSQPNPDFGTGVTQLSWDDTQDVGLGKALPDPAAMTPELARRVMMRHYEGMPTRLSPHVQGLFRALVTVPDHPLILHCTAGKDRTGFTAALLLTTLGVPRDQIVADYLLTNQTVDLRARLVEDETGLGIPQGRSYMGQLPAAALQAVLAADADYLAAALSAVERAHGSVNRYLRDAIGIDEDDLATLAQSLLEPA
jgi:protein-tyrosine phosphatase